MYSSEVQLQSAIFFETPEELFARVFRELKPRTAVPAVRAEFCRFANPNSFVRWDESGFGAPITRIPGGAPPSRTHALWQTLLSKRHRPPATPTSLKSSP